jgi:hypothetical protein
VEWKSDTLVEEAPQGLKAGDAQAATPGTNAQQQYLFNYQGPSYLALGQPRKVTFNFWDMYIGAQEEANLYPATLQAFLGSPGSVDVTAIAPRNPDGSVNLSSRNVNGVQTQWEGKSESDPAAGPTEVSLVLRYKNGEGKVIGKVPVWVFNAGMAVDYNRDGNIDFDDPITKTGPDHLPNGKSFEFWVNDNYDIKETPDGDNLANIQMYQNEASGRAVPFVGFDGSIVLVDQPDYDLPRPSCERDLEDYARLHIRTAPLGVPAYSPLKYKLYFTANQGEDPRIKLFKRALNASGEPYSGEEYIRDLAGAAAQLQADAATTAPICTAYGNDGLVDLSKAVDITGSLPPSGWLAPYVFEGAHAGQGNLTLAVTDASGVELARYKLPVALKEITDLYDEYTVGDNRLLGPGTLEDVHVMPDAPVVGEDYIVAVHGWNWDVWQKQRYAQSVFKRLYWLGYKGRFGSFRWPDTFGGPGDIFGIVTFDFSEYHAYQSGTGLKQLLERLKGDGYKVHLYAHSQGNIVAGEALREAGLTGGAYPLVIDSYTASQAAVAARLYDPDYPETNLVPTNSEALAALEVGAVITHVCPAGITWPDIQGHYPRGLEDPSLPAGTTAGYFEPVKLAVKPGMMFNFYNPQDYAVGEYRSDSASNGSWLLDQFVKPYRIVYQLNPANWLGFKYGASGLTDDEKEYFIRNANRQDKFCLSLPLNIPLLCDASFQCVGDMTNFADPEERFKILAFGGRSRSRALGGMDSGVVPDPNTSGFKDTQHPGNYDLYSNLGWKYQHVYHDGQFWGCFAKVQGYWKQFMENIGMTPR